MIYVDYPLLLTNLKMHKPITIELKADMMFCCKTTHSSDSGPATVCFWLLAIFN